MLASEQIVAALQAGSGMFQHGHTYICHPMPQRLRWPCSRLSSEIVCSSRQQQGAYLQQALHDVLGGLPYVGDTRGRGLFAGVELVCDKERKTAFDPLLKLQAIKAQHGARAAGLSDGRNH